MNNMDNYFLFKSKDNILAELYYENNIFHLNNVYVEPHVVYFMLKDDYLLNKWIEERKSSISRVNFYEIMKLGDIHNNYDFVNISLCLSLTDNFWIVRKNNNNNVNWKKISLFRNTFSSAYTNIASGRKTFEGVVIKTPSPEFSIGGSSLKYIKRNNNIINLYKSFSPGGITGNAETAFSGSFSEYFVSQLLNFLNYDFYVDYDLVKHKTISEDIICSKCNFFTNEDNSSIDLEDILIYNSNDYYDRYSQHLDELLNLFSKYSNSLRSMMIIDCIVLNVDRHSENISFLYNDKLEFNMSPIFDFDHSLFYNLALKNITKEKYFDYIKSSVLKTYVNHTFEEQLRLCAYPDTKKC